MSAAPEIVVYVPAGGHPATVGIARGSAIVGRPVRGGAEVRIYFEGGVYGQVNMTTLADRARHAFGRLAEDYPTTACRTVPREALVAVGTFEPRAGRIILTGLHSEAVVAAWLGVIRLNPEELGSNGARDRGR
ncbi:MAG: hypothetical protein JST08_00285 [Actinobacteria bacterium]|nr:hypothetical protein [Actinomycetota bacterium]